MIRITLGHRYVFFNVCFFTGHLTWIVMILSAFFIFNLLTPCLSAPQDPRLIVYPGDVNIALLVNSHNSTKPGTCGPQINLQQVRGAMTAIWSVNQINMLRANRSGLRLGVYVYDTCTDEEITERQVVRLLGHLEDIQSTSCDNIDARGAPLIGVISSGAMLGSSMHLLTSFQVPIITIQERDPMFLPQSTLFTVASSLKYLSKGVVGLLTKLNWSAATLVVSDEVPLYYTKILEEIALKVKFNVQSTPNERSAMGNNANSYQQGKLSPQSKPNQTFHAGSSTSSSYSTSSSSTQQSVKNTILFLSPHESLKLFTSLRSPIPPESEDFDWIVVTSKDIVGQLKLIYKGTKDCHTKPIYLILPQQEKLPELGKFLKKELFQMGDSMDPSFRQFLDIANSLANETSGHEIFSSMIKAIWSYNLALQSYESKYCDDMRGRECLKGISSNLISMMMDEIKLLNDTIDQDSFQSLNGFRINFDEEHYLSTNRFALKAITTRCEVVDMGFFEDGQLLTDTDTHKRGGEATEDTVKASQSNSISSLPNSVTSKFQSRRTNLHYSNKTASLGSRRRKQSKSMVKESAKLDIIRLRPIFNPSNFQVNSSFHPFAKDKPLSGRSLDSGQFKSLRETYSKQIDPLFTSEDVFRQRYSSFFSWLGWAWTVVIVSMSSIGVLVTLYMFTYIMMKSCEGAIKKSNQDLATFHLLSIIIVYFGAVLYIYQPSALMCAVRSSVHNISLTMLFASLFQRGLHLRAQKWIGLGGKISKLNQIFTLIFIVGIQVALEVQRWSYETPWSQNLTFLMPKECFPKPKEYLFSQAYLIVVVSLLITVAFSARKQPFAFKDGKHVFITSIIICPIYLLSTALVENLAVYRLSIDKDAFFMDKGQSSFKYHNAHYYFDHIRDIISSISMILMASTSLLGVFGPIIYTIHKYGILPPKNASYAESLSTAFTLFRGLDGNPSEATLLDHFSAMDSSSDGKSQRSSTISKTRGKSYKNYRHQVHPFFPSGQQAQNSFTIFGLKPEVRERSCPFNHCRNHLSCTYGECTHLDKSGLIRNPLYEDKNYRSAYP